MRPATRLTVRAWLAAVPVAAVLWVLFPGGVLADCPASPTPAEALKSAPVVFVGIVTAVADDARTATFDVQEIWKGPNVADPTTVYGGGVTHATPAADARTWTVGGRYLVFPSVDADGNLLDSQCSPTSPYQAAYDDLRPPSAHPPQGPPTSGPPGDPPIAAVFLLIVLFGTAGALLLWRTGRIESPS